MTSEVRGFSISLAFQFVSVHKVQINVIIKKISDDR